MYTVGRQTTMKTTSLVYVVNDSGRWRKARNDTPEQGNCKIYGSKSASRQFSSVIMIIGT